MTIGNITIADALILFVEQHAARRAVVDYESVMLRAGYTQSARIDFGKTIEVIRIGLKRLATQGLGRPSMLDDGLVRNGERSYAGQARTI